MWNMTPSTKPEVQNVSLRHQKGPSHDRMQHARRIRWRLAVRFSDYASGQTDIYTHHNILQPSRGQSIYTVFTLAECSRYVVFVCLSVTLFVRPLIGKLLELTASNVGRGDDLSYLFPLFVHSISSLSFPAANVCPLKIQLMDLGSTVVPLWAAYQMLLCILSTKSFLAVTICQESCNAIFPKNYTICSFCVTLVFTAL